MYCRSQGCLVGGEIAVPEFVIFQLPPAYQGRIMTHNSQSHVFITTIDKKFGKLYIRLNYYFQDNHYYWWWQLTLTEHLVFIWNILPVSLTLFTMIHLRQAKLIDRRKSSCHHHQRTHQSYWSRASHTCYCNYYF